MSDSLVLLTGATGYVGSRLLKKLESLGVAMRFSARRGSARMNSSCCRVGAASNKSTVPLNSRALNCSRRQIGSNSPWLPAGNHTNWRAAVIPLPRDGFLAKTPRDL